MIKLTYEQIAEKIKEKSGISQEELDQRVKEKMDHLSGLISKDGAAHIIANELGVNAFEEISGKIKLNKLLPGMRSVEVVGKIMALYDIREFTTQRGNGKVGSFFIADESGRSRITCWNSATDKMAGLKEGSIIKIKNGYAKENNGKVELHLNDNSEIEINPAGETVEVPDNMAVSDMQRKKIAELAESDFNVEILGTIVQVFDPRFFEVCPQCGKRARQREDKFHCDQHQEVQPEYSYVMNAIIDDGTETIRTVLFRQQAEKFIGKPREAMLQYREEKEKFEEVKTDLLGQMVKLGGRVNKNTMFDRLELMVNNVDTNPDPEAEIARLKTA
ncbi:hypothetical protein HQ545_08495 [Candidatus Woesearchaeota archaeon]|nr:hypothetical protein [Candidatus Woesearchaeota archaeon]